MSRHTAIADKVSVWKGIVTICSEKIFSVASSEKNCHYFLIPMQKQATFFLIDTTIYGSAIGMHYAFFKEASSSDVNLSKDALNQITHYFIRVDQTTAQV